MECLTATACKFPAICCLSICATISYVSIFVIVPFASLKLGRPVKWIEDRMEHLISANHSREHVCELEMAAKKDGTILGMRATVYGALGGYVRTHGASVPVGTGSPAPGAAPALVARAGRYRITIDIP